ncbi:MAG: DUF4430 domain-containing protein [Candidatus Diapherotrites archaeon]|nr:DUF4430 domain-containing protein [Candidatus Diapherotrites archaeon]
MNRFIFIAFVLALISASIFVQTQVKEQFVSAQIGTVSIELQAYNSENELVLDKNIQIQKGKTAFQIMQENTVIEFQDFSFGKFITSINGLQADSSKEYWAFYVNQEYSSVGVQEYIAENPAKLEFRLETISE